MLLLIGLGVFGVISAAIQQEDTHRSEARKAASDLAASIQTAIRESYTPAVLLADMISEYPDWRELEPKFPALAAKLLSHHPNTRSMELTPFGRLAAMYPAGSNPNPLGTDLLSPEAGPIRDIVLNMIANPNMTILTGPYLDQQSENKLFSFGLRTVSTVFAEASSENDTFNIPGPGPTNCTKDGVNICYDAERKLKYWGNIGCAVDFVGLRNTYKWDEIDTKGGYNFLLYRVDQYTGQYIELARSKKLPSDAMTINVTTVEDNEDWILEISRRDGWQPAWRNALIATTVVVAVLLGCMLAALMVKQQQHTDLLLSIVPKQAVSYLETGRPYARYFNNVTVLFSDIVEYTQISSGLTPLEVANLLNEVFEVYDRLCIMHNMYRCDVIGDAYLAVAGAPEEEDPCKAAVKAARLAQAMVEATRNMVTASGLRIRIRLGLHSGPVVAAVVGGCAAPKYTLLGDTVNTASRLETTSEPMRIHVSNETAELLRLSGTDVCLMPRGEVDIKGKGVMSTLWLDSSTSYYASAMATGTVNTTTSGAVHSGSAVNTLATMPSTGGYIGMGRNVVSSSGAVGTFASRASPALVGRGRLHSGSGGAVCVAVGSSSDRSSREEAFLALAGRKHHLLAGHKHLNETSEDDSTTLGNGTPGRSVSSAVTPPVQLNSANSPRTVVGSPDGPTGAAESMSSPGAGRSGSTYAEVNIRLGPLPVPVLGVADAATLPAPDATGS